MNKVLFDKSGLNDITNEVENLFSESSVIAYEVGNKLYIGSLYPFNAIYFKFDVANTQSATMSMKYWSNEWKSPVELIDGTKGFAQDGYVSFVPSKNYRYVRESTKENGSESITGLGDVEIYDLYWIYIEFDVDLDALTSIQYMGHKFCGDEDLYIEHRAFRKSSLLQAYEAGKTTWENEIIRASELTIEALIEKGIIKHESEILDYKKLKLATVPRTAAIIYANLGDDYNDQIASAMKAFYSRLNKKIFHTDLDEDGRLDYRETDQRVGGLYR